MLADFRNFITNPNRVNLFRNNFLGVSFHDFNFLQLILFSKFIQWMGKLPILMQLRMSKRVIWTLI